MFNQFLRRREFIKLSGLVVGALPFLGRQAQAVTPRFSKSQIGALQGPTNANSTLITVVIHKELQPEFSVTNGGVVEAKRLDMGYHDFIIYNLFISGLQLGTPYTLLIEDHNQGISAIRNFQTLDLRNTDAKIAVISCSNHAKADLQTLMYQKLNASAPDAIFLIGDMVYANRPADTIMGRPAPPDKAYELYIKTFLSLDLYTQANLIPSFSLWDDHDMGKDNADSSHPNKAIMMKMYRNFFPMDARISEVTLGPGMSFSLDAFGLQSIFLDGRLFAASGGVLGADQLQWAKSQYSRNRSRNRNACLMILGQQFWNYNDIHDSYQRRAGAEFAGFLQHLKTNRRPTMFISGDVHYSQLQKISAASLGYPTYEITSSAIFSSSANDLYIRGDGNQLRYFGKQNFLMLDQIQASGVGLDLRVTCVSHRSDVEFQNTLSV